MELLEDKSAISGLKLIGEVDRSPRGIPTHRYSFVDQICDVRKNSDVFLEGILYEDIPKRIGSVVELDYENNTVDIKRLKTTTTLILVPFGHGILSQQKLKLKEC